MWEGGEEKFIVCQFMGKTSDIDCNMLCVHNNSASTVYIHCTCTCIQMPDVHTSH